MPACADVSHRGGPRVLPTLVLVNAVWVAQNLIRAMETGGESKPAELLRRVGGLGETSEELAYRLCVICERKKWAEEALVLGLLGLR